MRPVTPVQFAARTTTFFGPSCGAVKTIVITASCRSGKVTGLGQKSAGSLDSVTKSPGLANGRSSCMRVARNVSLAPGMTSQDACAIRAANTAMMTVASNRNAAPGSEAVSMRRKVETREVLTVGGPTPTLLRRKPSGQANMSVGRVDAASRVRHRSNRARVRIESSQCGRQPSCHHRGCSARRCVRDRPGRHRALRSRPPPDLDVAHLLADCESEEDTRAA